MLLALFGKPNPPTPFPRLCISRIFLNIWESDRSGAIKPPFLHDQFSINSTFYQEERVILCQGWWQLCFLKALFHLFDLQLVISQLLVCFLNQLA